MMNATPIQEHVAMEDTGKMKTGKSLEMGSNLEPLDSEQTITQENLGNNESVDAPLMNYKDKIMSLEKCLQDQKMLTLVFEKKYQETLLNKITAEFKYIYEKDNGSTESHDKIELNNFRKRNLDLLNETRGLMTKVNKLLEDKETLTQELFDCKERLFHAEEKLKKLLCYKQYLQIDDFSTNVLLEKLYESTKSLSSVTEQNRLLHEALKSAKGYILAQNEHISKSPTSQILIKENSIENDVRLQAAKLAKELYETRQMARKEQELMYMALSTLYEKLVATNNS